METTDLQFKTAVLDVIKEYDKNGAFVGRKITDTPTDMFGIVPKQYVDKYTSKLVTLTDGATVALDASLGRFFYLVATGDRTISVPTNASSRSIIIMHQASGADRTLTLTTGSAGAFRFGVTVSALTATTSGKTDYIGCIYKAADDRWDVVAVSKGY